MTGRDSVAVVTRVAAGCVVALACGVTAAGAAPQLPAASGAAASGKPVFSRGIGAVLPTSNELTEVSVSCPESSPSPCRGSVALVARGDTARALGSGALASRSFTLARAEDADLRLRLSGPARTKLSHGPLLVTAELRAAGSGSQAAMRDTAIAREQPYYASGRLAARAASTERSWSWTIPKGRYLVLRQFSCPAGTPYLSRGPHTLAYKRFIGGEWDADMRATAGDRTGYAGFDRPKLGPAAVGDSIGTVYRFMEGWPQGSVWFNSVWAPLGKEGHFKLTVQCTAGYEAGDLGAARLHDYGANPENSGYKDFFPWKWSY